MTGNSRSRFAASWSLGLVLPFVATLASCVSPSDLTPEPDVDAVRYDVVARAQVEPPARSAWDDPPDIARATHALLADGLSEDDAVALALLRNPEVRARYEDLGISRADLVQAGLLQNPVISGNSKFFSPGSEVELGLSWPLLDIFFVPLRKKIAEARLAAARHTLASDVITLVFDVRRAVVSVKAAQQRLAIERSALDAADTSRELMDKLHAAGNVAPPLRTATAITAAQLRLSVAAAESALLESKEDLNELLGIFGPDIAWTLSGDLAPGVASEVDLEHVETRAVAASLDLARERSELEALSQQYGLTSWEGIFPGVDIGAAALHESGSGFGIGPSGNVTLPIFDQGQAQNARALAHVRQSLARQEAVALSVRSAARRLRNRLQTLRERSDYQRMVSQRLASQFVHETLLDYNAMQIGAFDVLTARRKELDVQQQQIETLEMAWHARLDLEELMAGHLNRQRVHMTPTPRMSGASDAAPKGH